MTAAATNRRFNHGGVCLGGFGLGRRSNLTILSDMHTD